MMVLYKSVKAVFVLLLFSACTAAPVQVQVVHRCLIQPLGTTAQGLLVANLVCLEKKEGQ